MERVLIRLARWSLQPPGYSKKCLTTREKYNAAQKLALGIADVLSCNGMSVFRRRVEVLEHLLRSWSQDIDVVVLAAVDNSDVEDQVEDVVTDEQVDCYTTELHDNTTGATDKTDAISAGLNDSTGTGLDDCQSGSAQNGQTAETSADLSDAIATELD